MSAVQYIEFRTTYDGGEHRQALLDLLHHTSGYEWQTEVVDEHGKKPEVRLLRSTKHLSVRYYVDVRGDKRKLQRCIAALAEVHIYCLEGC